LNEAQGRMWAASYQLDMARTAIIHRCQCKCARGGCGKRSCLILTCMSCESTAVGDRGNENIGGPVGSTISRLGSKLAWVTSLGGVARLG
jgi:hypothetical protein